MQASIQDCTLALLDDGIIGPVRDMGDVDPSFKRPRAIEQLEERLSERNGLIQRGAERQR